jgi:hypothetical protein
MDWPDAIRRLFQPTPPEVQRRLGWGFHAWNLAFVALVGGLYAYGLSCIPVGPTLKAQKHQEIQSQKQQAFEQMQQSLYSATETLMHHQQRLAFIEQQLQEQQQKQIPSQK